MSQIECGQLPLQFPYLFSPLFSVFFSLPPQAFLFFTRVERFFLLSNSGQLFSFSSLTLPPSLLCLSFFLMLSSFYYLHHFQWLSPFSAPLSIVLRLLSRFLISCFSPTNTFFPFRQNPSFFSLVSYSASVSVPFNLPFFSLSQRKVIFFAPP